MENRRNFLKTIFAVSSLAIGNKLLASERDVSSVVEMNSHKRIGDFLLRVLLRECR